jgi:hypothetical protein
MSEMINSAKVPNHIHQYTMIQMLLVAFADDEDVPY